MKHLEDLRLRKERLVVGLMSGTSADGVDAALVRIHGVGPQTRVETIASLTREYSRDVRKAVLGLSRATAPEIARWNMDLGELFAQAALAVIGEAHLATTDVHLIGSHGQTVVHLPRAPGVGAATLQIAEPCVIAERTGISVVADFRARDVAADGEGAPLVPLVDWLLMRPDTGSLVAQNLGGVGNVTLVTQHPSDVVAFDTGPANAPIDAAAALATQGRAACDEGGAMAARGRVDQPEVERMLEHPFFAKAPPKSLDRAVFGAPFVVALQRRRPDLVGDDLVATLTEFVARSVASAHRNHLPRGTHEEVVISGGGVHNRTLMNRLRELLGPLRVRTSDELGIDPDAKEAIAFAVLANETLFGRPGNLPRVTGARRPVVLGKVCP